MKKLPNTTDAPNPPIAPRFQIGHHRRGVCNIGLNTEMARGEIQSNRPRLLLKKVGRIALGDRWKGELKVEGNRLYIGKDTGWFRGRKDYPNAGQKLVGWHDLGGIGGIGEIRHEE